MIFKLGRVVVLEDEDVVVELLVEVEVELPMLNVPAAHPVLQTTSAEVVQAAD
jgi:hypothetical protein